MSAEDDFIRESKRIVLESADRLAAHHCAGKLLLLTADELQMHPDWKDFRPVVLTLGRFKAKGTPFFWVGKWSWRAPTKLSMSVYSRVDIHLAYPIKEARMSTETVLLSGEIDPVQVGEMVLASPLYRRTSKDDLPRAKLLIIEHIDDRFTFTDDGGIQVACSTGRIIFGKREQRDRFHQEILRFL